MSFFKDLLKAAIIGAAIATGVGVWAGVSMAAGIGSYFATQFAIQFVLGAVSYALADKPSTSLKDQTITTRNPIAPLQVVYGRTRVGGVIVYMESTDSNKYLHMVIAFAGHEIDAVESIYFNEELVTLDGADFGYSGKARIKFKLGTDDQTAFSDLINESDGKWTNNHRLRGRACAYVRLEFDRDVFPNGVPNISFVVRGKKVYDPRSGQTVWSANPALCLNDYLTNERFGLGADYAAEIDSSALIAAANACDQAIALAGGGTQPRYLANGTFYTSDAPADVITRLLSSMVGKVVRTGGKWRILAGIYYTPTLTFDEDDLRGGIKVQTLLSRRESFNAVKGVFISKDDNYVKADFPSVISSTAVAEDGEEVYRSIELPFTTDPVMAQRLAKIDLLKARQQITVTMPLKLSGLQASIGDIIQVNNTRLGWSNKLFEVVNLTMAYDEALGVDLMLREISADVFAWETSEEQTYDPAPNTNLPNAFVVAPVTDLTLAAQTLLSPDGTSQSGILVTWTPPLNAFVERYEVQYIRGSSNFDWGLITDASTATNDHGSIATTATGGADYGVITEATSTAEPQYNSIFVTTPYYFINGAVAGAEYAVRVRAINVMGVRSSWSTSNQTTYGDTTAPDAPSGLTASGGYRQITVSWINPSVSDFDYVEIFANIVNNFSTATRIAVLRGSMFVDAPLAINYTKYYWVRAVDRSGNISGETASATATTEFVDSDSFSAEVLNLFSEAGAYGIEPVASLPTTGDFDGQIKYDTTNNKLWRWDSTGGVWTDDIFSITSGSVDAASFAAGIEPVAIESSLPNPTGYTGPQVVFLTTDNKLYRYTGTAWVASVSTSDLSGTLGSNLFSNSIRPVEVVGALPTTGNFDGRVAVLTTDGKLYRYSSGAWTAAVSTADLSGTVSNAQIAGLAASKITGTLSDAQLAEISAAKISGQLTDEQIAEIAAAKVTGELTNDQIADLAATKITGQLTDAQIADLGAAKITGTITGTQITDEAISTEKLAAGAITTAKLAASAVTANEIAANAITTAKIDAGAITTAKLAANAVTANEIAANAVTTAKIDAGAITTAKLAAGSVTANEIATNAITSVKINAEAITTAKIAAGAVTADTIGANAITSAKIDAGAITAAKIAAGAIEADAISAGAVTAGKIAADAVTATEIAADSITTAKIAAGAVTATLLAADSVTADKLAANSVTAGKIAAAAISATEIAADAITTDKIAADAITSNKIAAATIQGDRIAANTITGGLIAASGIITNTAQIDDGLITNAKISNLAADRIVADKIDSRGLSIKDADGNIILAAGATPSLKVPGINYFNQSDAPYDYTVVKAGDTWKTSTDQYKATANLGATVQAFAAKCQSAITGYITFGLPSTKVDSVLQHFLYNQDNGSFKAGDINNSGAVDINDVVRWGAVAGGVGTGAENTWATDVWNLAKAKYVSVWELAGTVGAVLDDGLGGTNITGQITPSNVSTWIAAAAIDTAYIKNAAVSTLKIAGFAVTAPASAFSSGDVGRTQFDGVFTDAQEITFTTTGQTIYIACSAQMKRGRYYDPAGNPIEYWPREIRLIRDSTVLVTILPTLGIFDIPIPIFNFSETIAAGTYIYKFQFKSSPYDAPLGGDYIDYPAKMYVRSMFIIETKR